MAILAKVSPERTVYAKDRELGAGVLVEAARVEAVLVEAVLIELVWVEVVRVLAAVS